MFKRTFVHMFVVSSLVALVGCAGTDKVGTPTVDYVEGLDVYSAPHKDSFLTQLAMNYRSYAIYNARTSGQPEVGELFAQKAVTAFSGDVPLPETLSGWSVDDDKDAEIIGLAYENMLEEFENGATEANPGVAAEVQAKFDCWVSATATEQDSTAAQCRDLFVNAMDVLRNCKQGECKVEQAPVSLNKEMAVERKGTVREFYPSTRSLKSVGRTPYPRDGIVIVNNIKVPENIVKTVPVSDAKVPFVFNQNIYGGDKSVSNSGNTLAVNNGGDKKVSNSGNSFIKAENSSRCDCKTGKPIVIDCDKKQDMEPRAVLSEEPLEQVGCPCEENLPTLGEELVTRDEFINMMMAMRAEIKAINDRLDTLKPNEEKAVIKVQQIPLEPTQHVMEEIFEVHFDFNKAIIKPEYADLIRELATATQNNKNIKVSVVGHTDTVGTKSYNYALGGRRAEAVQKMLIEYGIPASQIVAVSAGEEDLKVKTGDNVRNAENRRVRVVKETSYTEPGKLVPVATVIAEGDVADVQIQEECLDCGKSGEVETVEYDQKDENWY